MHLRFKSKEILLLIFASFVLGEASIAKNKAVIEATTIDSLIFTGATNNNISDSTNWDYDALSFEIALQNETAEVHDVIGNLVVEDSIHFASLDISGYDGTIHLNDNFSADTLRILNTDLSFESNLLNHKGVYTHHFFAESSVISLDTSILVSSNVLISETATIIIEDNVSGIAASDSIVVRGNYIDYVGTYTKLLRVAPDGHYFTLGNSILDSIFIEPSGILENHSIGTITFQIIDNKGSLINENTLNGGDIKNRNIVSNSGTINTFDFINDGSFFNFGGIINSTGVFPAAHGLKTLTQVLLMLILF